jgi:hypothetical protein
MKYIYSPVGHLFPTGGSPTPKSDIVRTSDGRNASIYASVSGLPQTKNQTEIVEKEEEKKEEEKKEGGRGRREPIIIPGTLLLPPTDLKMVLFDMDKTLLSIHTRGFYKGKVDDLLEHVTKAFEILVHFLQEKGIVVGIVTFSDDMLCDGYHENHGKEHPCLSGKNLVMAILNGIFDKEIVDKIYIAAKNPKDHNISNPDYQIKEDKSWHISEVITYLEEDGIVEDGIVEDGIVDIKHENILLFDDSEPNIKAAEEDGVRAFHVYGEEGLTLDMWNSAIEQF